MLYWLRLSYDGIREFLGHLGCPLSKATVWANVRASGLLGNRHRLRADGTLVVQARPHGAAARMTLRGPGMAVRLEGAADGDLILTAGAIQPEAARLLQRRVEEAARRLGLSTEAHEEREAVRA